MKKGLCLTQGGKKISKVLEKFLSKGLDRNKVFTDFLDICICMLSGGKLEEEYRKIAVKYTVEQLEWFGSMFGILIHSMEEEQRDILGDVFETSISYGANGQYFTPEHICELMAQLQGVPKDKETVSDPCCGSGRMLLAIGRINPRLFFSGQDIDYRCVKMTTLNLALNGVSGIVKGGNSLMDEVYIQYLVGFNGTGFISIS